MRIFKLILCLACCLPAARLHAQVRYDNTSFRIEKVNSFIPGSGPDLFPHLSHLEAPNPGGSSYNSFLLRQKEINAANFRPQSPDTRAYKTASAPAAPFLGRNFQGNDWDDGVPTDNNMAISNGGKIVSVQNSTMYLYSLPGTTPTIMASLESFTDTSLLARANKFDPKVLYDPKQDKFILVYLCGSSSTTNKIVIAFSSTNDPAGSWNQYALPGNPFSNGTWSDYPIIAMSDDELFITVNLIKDDSSWQAGFTESIIWQVGKSEGYSGAALNTNTWHNISFLGQKIRNLCPLSGGSTTQGPNLFLVSDRNFDASNDTFLVAEITNKQSASPVLNVHAAIADHNYGLPPSALQRTNLWLQTNDARVLGGFYENNTLHVVGNSIHPTTGKAGIFHCIIDNPATANSAHLTVLGDTLFEYGYPNISYSGRYAGDNQAIISFDHVARDSFAGTSAIFYERWSGYSDRLTIKRGESFVNVISGNYERWGDYSGSQRKYDEPGVVWMSGFYGKRISTPTIVYSNQSWIAELTSPYSIGASIPNTQRPELTAQVYPNPAAERVLLEFTMEESRDISVQLNMINGAYARELFHDKAKQGLNRFSFITDDLTNGTYILEILDQGKVIADKKVIIQK